MRAFADQFADCRPARWAVLGVLFGVLAYCGPAAYAGHEPLCDRGARQPWQTMELEGQLYAVERFDYRGRHLKVVLWEDISCDGFEGS